jgi:hypothetical protein
MDSRKTLQSKKSGVTPRQGQLTALRKEAFKRFDMRANLKNSNECSNQHSIGFPGAQVCESFGFVTSKKLGSPAKSHKEQFRTRNKNAQGLSPLQVGGNGFPSRVAPLRGDDVSSGAKSFADSQEPNEMIEMPYHVPDSETTKESKLPSLPNISTVKERPRSKSFGKHDVSKLARNLNLIDGRRKGQCFNGGKKKEETSRNHLETQLSLPKITIDEVLKSWDIQPSRTTRTRRKRSSSNASVKHDPMEFLTQKQNDVDKKSQQDFSSCYEEVKGCRYLRLGKKEEEERFHSRSCPCNSCEHGEALKESPYLNA